LCIVLVEKYLWEPGDEADTLGSHLVDHTQLTLDGERISTKYRGDFTLVGPQFSKGDLNGQYLGSHGGFAEGCFSVNLGPGLHLATIDVISTSGVVRSYTWAFHADSVIPRAFATMDESTSQSEHATATAIASLPAATRTAISTSTHLAVGTSVMVGSATVVAGFPGTIAARTSTAQGTPNPSSGRNTR
jgi:hypothetical protein